MYTTTEDKMHEHNKKKQKIIKFNCYSNKLRVFGTMSNAQAEKFIQNFIVLMFFRSLSIILIRISCFNLVFRDVK